MERVTESKLIAMVSAPVGHLLMPVKIMHTNFDYIELSIELITPMQCDEYPPGKRAASALT